MKSVFSKIKEKKEVFNRFGILFLFLFYILTLLPSFQTFTVFQSSLVLNGTYESVYKLVIFSLFALLSIFLLVINEIRIKTTVVFLLGLYFVFSLIPNIILNSTIRISSSYFSSDLTYTPSIQELILSSVYCVRFIVMFIFFTQILPKISTKKDIIWLIKGIILFSIFSIFYLLIYQFDFLINSFKNSSGYSSEVVSLYQNKNTLGIALTICVVSCVFLYENEINRVFNIVLLIVFIFFEAILFCRTALIISIMYIYTHFLFEFLSKKRHKNIFVALTVLFAAAITFVSLVLAIPAIRNSPIGSKIYNPINNFITDLSSANGRLSIVPVTFKIILTPVRLLFGYGDILNNTILHNVTFALYGASIDVHSSYHNGFLSLITSGGIIKLSLYVLLIWPYTIKAAANIRTKLKDYSYILILGCFIVYQLFEQILLCETTTVSIQWCILLFSVYIYYNYDNRIAPQADTFDSYEVMI